VEKMIDITSINAVSGILAAIGVLVGVVFAVLQLRDLVKTRQTDLVIRLYSAFSSQEWLESWEKIRDVEITDYNNYKKKHRMVDVNRMILIYEEIGVLLQRGLIDIGLIDDLFGGSIRMTWEKLEPLIESARKKLNEPEIGEWWEYLYNEMQKREQTLQST